MDSEVLMNGEQGRPVRTTVARSEIGSHTVKNQDSFFPQGNIPSKLSIIQLVCDGISGNEEAQRQHTGLAWAENIAAHLPWLFEKMRSRIGRPQFHFQDQDEMGEGMLRDVLGILKPDNDTAVTMLKYFPIFRNPHVGNHPYLSLRGYKTAMGTRGDCIVASNFEADPDDYYKDNERHKVNLEEVISDGYVDYTKLATTTLQEIRQESQKYIQFIFPSEGLSIETIALLRALEKTTKNFANDYRKKHSSVDGGTTITGALETANEIIIFTLGDSRTAVSIDDKLVALTGRFNTIAGLSSWAGIQGRQIHQNNGADISIMRIPKHGQIPQDLCNLGKLEDNTPFQLWLNDTSGINIIEAANKAVIDANTDDDKTIVITDFAVSDRKWRVISFTDGVFNPPPTQKY